ncbi:MAG: lycopene cyclase family protein [Janthinobacterium lividum]
MSELAIVGLGAAGASLAWRLSGSGVAFTVFEAPAGAAVRTQERTWCTWGPGGPGPFAHLVVHQWPRVRVTAPDGSAVRADLGNWRYRMLSSTTLDAAVRTRLHTAGVEVREEVVTDARGLARTVVDTRPARLPRTGRTVLFQHFLGHRIRTQRPSFDSTTVELMDFRVPQPGGGVAFGYVLPTSEHEALVEYTEFSARLLSAEGYRSALGEYLQRRGIGAHEVLSSEHGVIPMTDARFPPSTIPGVVRWGAASGSVRPSTGYAFSVLQRQADVLAGQVVSGEPVVVPRAHTRRHLLMDSIVLQALASGRIEGAQFFVDLFRRNPVQRVLGFLDGATGPADDVRLMATSPRGPMVSTLLGRLGQVRR